MLKISAGYELGWSNEALLRGFDPFQPSLYPSEFFNNFGFWFPIVESFTLSKSSEIVTGKFYSSKLKLCIPRNLPYFILSTFV